MQSLALLLLRVGVGGLMLYSRGFVKIANFSELFDRFQDPLGLGSEVSLTLVIIVEVACSILIIVGLFTRLAAIPLVATIILALLFVHPGDPWPKIEVALLYLIPFATIFVSGPGWYSMDNVIRRKRKRKKATVTTASIPGPAELMPPTVPGSGEPVRPADKTSGS
jgi:putative oxidoreductase